MKGDRLRRLLRRKRLRDAWPRLGVPSGWWLRILRALERDFGRVPVFLDAGGTPRVFVVGGEDRIAVIFATPPETAVAALVGRRACEVIGHPEFTPGSRNGERLIVEAVMAAALGEAAAALVLTFGLPLDVTGTRWMDELIRESAEWARHAPGTRPHQRSVS